MRVRLAVVLGPFDQFASTDDLHFGQGMLAKFYLGIRNRQILVPDLNDFGQGRNLVINVGVVPKKSVCLSYQVVTATLISKHHPANLV